MRHSFLLGTIASMILFSGCASKPTISSDAQKRLQDKWASHIGTAKKADFVEDFGTAEWCRTATSGEETCRFYKELKTKYLGDGDQKKAYKEYDEVVADFGTDGTLKSFKATAQR
jgi:hypothetical protein